MDNVYYPKYKLQYTPLKVLTKLVYELTKLQNYCINEDDNNLNLFRKLKNLKDYLPSLPFSIPDEIQVS